MFHKLAATVVVLSLCLTGCSVSVTKDNGSSLRAEETFSVYYANGDDCTDVTDDMLDYLQGSWYSPTEAYGDGYTVMFVKDTMSTGLGSFRPDTSRIVSIYKTKGWDTNGESEYKTYHKALLVDYGSGATYVISIETGNKGKIRVDGVPLKREDL